MQQGLRIFYPNHHIDDKVYHAHGPALFLTPAATPHSFQTEQDVTGHVLTIRQSTIWRLLALSDENYSANRFQRGIFVSLTHISEEQSVLWKMMNQLWDNIQYEWTSHYAEREVALQNYVSLLLIQISRLSKEEDQGASIISDDIRLYNRFAKLVERQYKSGWAVPEYAKQVGVSESRLNHLCQRVSQSPPKQIIHERRLQEIKRLLTFTKLSVNEISFEMGFTDPRLFLSFF